MNREDTHKYDDIIHLAHPVSKRHPQMPPMNRAAQFAPFAALTGHDAAIKETARLTAPSVELSEDEKNLLDQRLCLIRENLAREPEIEFSCFEPDEKKDGGTYATVRGKVKKIDEFGHRVIFTDGTALQMEQILSIEGELFENMGESDM